LFVIVHMLVAYALALWALPQIVFANEGLRVVGPGALSTQGKPAPVTSEVQDDSLVVRDEGNGTFDELPCGQRRRQDMAAFIYRLNAHLQS